jgi:hypothetical protein
MRWRLRPYATYASLLLVSSQTERWSKPPPTPTDRLKGSPSLFPSPTHNGPIELTPPYYGYWCTLMWKCTYKTSTAYTDIGS